MKNFKISFQIIFEFPENSTEIHDILGFLDYPILTEFLENHLISLIERLSMIGGLGVEVLIGGSTDEKTVKESGDVDANGGESEPSRS